jgi:predicted AAA+ superfamily ATPase
VGKTTLIKSLLIDRKDVISLPLQDPDIRRKYEADPGLLTREGRDWSPPKTLFIDEVQKVPELLDAVQYLVDEGKANAILTGSSARKLRRAGANLLPGRVKSFHLDPLTWSELGWAKENRIKALAVPFSAPPVEYTLEESMAFGSLPGIVTRKEEEERWDYLEAYASSYLEEEVRAEALTRKLGAFGRFLQLAASESGTSPNFSKLSMEAGVSAPAIREFYSILQDTLIVERVDPYLKNARKRILATPRFYLFDTGVRNNLAGLRLDAETAMAQKGILFEHAVVLEIIRRIRLLRKKHRVCFWRTSGGAEVDCVIDMGDEVIPIEIKASERVRLGELKGLVNFLEDYRTVARHGYVIFQGSHPLQLTENITALPWQYL